MNESIPILLIIALKLSALEPWFIRPAKGSVWKVTDCGSHLKRVATRGCGS